MYSTKIIRRVRLNTNGNISLNFFLLQKKESSNLNGINIKLILIRKTGQNVKSNHERGGKRFTYSELA